MKNLQVMEIACHHNMCVLYYHLLSCHTEEGFLCHAEQQPLLCTQLKNKEFSVPQADVIDVSGRFSWGSIYSKC